MKILSKAQLLLLHQQLVEQTGGSAEIRDESLLESALHAPFQTFGGTDLYPTIPEKASRLGFGLIQNHPFADGNKRIGTHAMLVFLAVNDIRLHYQASELTELIMGIASDKFGEACLLEWIKNHLI